MQEFDERLENLQQRLENLLKSQEFFQREISQLKYEINVLRNAQQKRRDAVQPGAPPQSAPSGERKTTNQDVDDAKFERDSSDLQNHARTPFQTKAPQTDAPKVFPKIRPPKQNSKSNIERFIGENLFSIAGILILIIGIAIIGKYAIDQNWITPLMRIVVGYAFGFGLLGFAFKLREKYLNFSSVLLSGAMAIMYFITFFAHSLYDIFSQTAAFVLMLIFTAFTVAAAINFNRQVIANIGLVGAYAIPFLLSNNSGNIAFLLSYVAIINIGILAVSVKKYWKSLFYLSFIFTWAIFTIQYFFNLLSAEHFNLALLFLAINFFTFYLTFIIYKLISRQPVALENLALIVSNSFIFYGIGYSLFSNREGFENYLGLFTVGNAAIHFIFALTISRLKSVSADLIYLLSALVITFATIAVPVELDGQFVTLLWTAEAAILFWIGRTKRIPLYEFYSLPLMFLASASLLFDWQQASYFETAQEIIQNNRPFFNGTFLTSLIFSLAFAFIFSVNRDEKHDSAGGARLKDALAFSIAGVGLLVFYNAFRMEIANYFHLRYLQSETQNTQSSSIGSSIFNYDLKTIGYIWQLNFTMLFLTALLFVNIRKFKNRFTALITLALSFFVLTIFLTIGLYYLGDLRESFVQQRYSDYYAQNYLNIFIRYISYAFVAGLLYAIYRSLRQDFLKDALAHSVFIFDFLLHVTLLLTLTSELITWADIFGYNDSYKLVTSIFWGIYAVGLIVLGIYKNKKSLRIGAICLFAVTLAKLFFYDIADLGTISKTVVFVSLGILLLIASFLYNKYKALIFDTN